MLFLMVLNHVEALRQLSDLTISDKFPRRSRWLHVCSILQFLPCSSYHCLMVPSGKPTELWKITIFNGTTMENLTVNGYKWQLSIAMLNYQRVTHRERLCHQLFHGHFPASWFTDCLRVVSADRRRAA